MIHLLLIADQHRLHDLFAESAERPDTVLSIATSLDAGIELISSTPPDLVFVQSRLSGLSGEIIMRHISGHLPETSQVILFSEGGRASFSDDMERAVTLDLTLSDRQLSSDIRDLVDKQLADKPHKAAAQAHGTVTENFVPTPLVAQEQPSPEPPEPTVPEPEPSASVPEPEAPQLNIATRFEAELEAELARHEPSPAADTMDEDRPLTLAQLEGITAMAPNSHPPAASSSVFRRLAPWLLTGVVLFVLVSAGGYLFGRWTAERQGENPPPDRAPVKKSLPAPGPAPAPRAAVKPAVSAPPATAVTPAPAPVAVPQPAKTPPRPLPSFVPRDGREPGYTASHPGWERYLDREREYKVFLERDSLKAIQIIDRSGKGLSPQLFTKALHELANVKDYKLASQEVKGEYLIKKGRLTPSSRVIIYKNKADNKLQAFVISFD